MSNDRDAAMTARFCECECHEVHLSPCGRGRSLRPSRSDRERGARRSPDSLQPLTPTLSPQRTGRGSTPRSPTVTGQIAALLLVVAPTIANAQSVEEFYRGKTLNMIIGYSVGGGY